MNEVLERKPAKSMKGWFTINISLGNDGESKRVFVGTNIGDFWIERGKDVDARPEVLTVLDCAEIGVVDQEVGADSETVVMRKRFPYTIVRAH